MKDVVWTLCATHREIERSLACLIRIAKESSGGALREPAAFAEGLRFFRVVAPEHSATEEETVFPRLRRAVQPELVRLLDTLEEEHGCADRAHDEAGRVGRLWLANGRLSTAETARLTAILEGLSGLYERHIRLEESDVFPLLGRTQ
jgi:hemerythrin-like domain-containing protein